MSTSVPNLLGGRYEVGELIGRGGMAEVHQGFDTRLSRPVAIKILRSDHVRDANFLARFRREAQSVAGLNHRSIVAVYDSGEDLSIESGGASVPVPYIVMEYVDGKTLRELLNERGHLTPHEASRITEGVLEALSYSHRMGMVHRDIKPANVMVGRDGAIKVMDFGIARAVADTQATMTQTSSVMGTAQYISPEQAEGHTVDARSDLYSTGCLLFELLTGRTPFVGEPVALTYQHVTKPPPLPSSLNSAVSDSLDAVVLHALTKDRDLRYQDAESFRADLQAARMGLPVSDAALASLRGLAATELVSTVPAPPVSPPPVAPPPTYLEPDTASYDPAYAEPRRSRTGTVVLVLALVAALAMLAFAGKTYLDSRPKLIAVPSVVGDPVATATARLKADFQVATNYVPSRTVAKDDVIKQEPKASERVTKGSLVTLTVSGGPATTRVPDLVGKSESEAKQLITDAGLEVGSIDTVDSPDQAKGDVVSSTPAAFAEADEGDAVSLKISSGEVTLPDLTGKTEDEARNILAELNLPVKTTTKVSTKPEGTVIEQKPKAGKVKVGQEVELTLAKAAPITQTTTITTTTTTTSSSTTSSSDSTTPTTSTSDTFTSPSGSANGLVNGRQLPGGLLDRAGSGGGLGGLLLLGLGGIGIGLGGVGGLRLTSRHRRH